MFVRAAISVAEQLKSRTLLGDRSHTINSITNHAHIDCRSCAYSPDVNSVWLHFFFAAATSKAVTSNVFLCYFHEYQLAVVAIDGQVRANPVQTGPTHTILLLLCLLLQGAERIYSKAVSRLFANCWKRVLSKTMFSSLRGWQPPYGA